MVSLQHDSDNGWFNVYENDTYIGHLWQRVDKKWLFEADVADIPEAILSDILAIRATLNFL